MSVTIKPSHPFSNGTSYEFFLESFCYRCKHGKINENGFAEYPEKGGCKIWDAMENARFDVSLFPCDDVVQIEKDGEVEYWNICKQFETDDTELMESYSNLFKERDAE